MSAIRFPSQSTIQPISRTIRAIIGGFLVTLALPALVLTSFPALAPIAQADEEETATPDRYSAILERYRSSRPAPAKAEPAAPAPAPAAQPPAAAPSRSAPAATVPAASASAPAATPASPPQVALAVQNPAAPAAPAAVPAIQPAARALPTPGVFTRFNPFSYQAGTLSKSESTLGYATALSLIVLGSLLVLSRHSLGQARSRTAVRIPSRPAITARR